MHCKTAILAPLIAGSMLGCAGESPPVPAPLMSLQDYATLAQGGGRLFRLEPDKSNIRIYAFRGGSTAALGHAHVLTAPQFTGYFYLPESGTGQARFDLEFPLDQLQVDDPASRAGLGPAFATAPTPEDRAGTRDHMLGERNLQAQRFPSVRIHSLRIVGDAPKFAVQVQIDMHGQTRTQWLALDVEGLPQRLEASGALVLRQTDFDVTPYSVLGGLLAVQDEVVVEFRLVGE